MGAMELQILDAPGFGEPIIFRRFVAGTRDADPTSPTCGNYIEATPAYVDTQITANVQCADNSKVIALNLDRARRSIEVFTSVQLEIVDEAVSSSTGRRGDRIWYGDGIEEAEWYEVKTADWYNDASGAGLSHGEYIAQKIIAANEPYMTPPVTL